MTKLNLKEILKKEKEQPLKLIYQKSKLYFTNYKKLLIFDDNHILLDSLDKRVTVKGKDLIVNRLEGDEILISGDRLTIEFR